MYKRNSYIAYSTSEEKQVNEWGLRMQDHEWGRSRRAGICSKKNGAATLIRVCDNVDRGRQRGTRGRHEGK